MGNKNQKSTGLWIPEEIKNDTKLDWTNKVLLSEIYFLCTLENGCFASDKHFGKLLGIGRSAVNKRVNWLKNNGYINTANHYKKNQCIGRTITKSGSVKKHTVVLEEDKDSSVEEQEVVPMEHFGVSPENTNNTFTNSDLIIQEKIHNTGAANNSGMSMNQFFTNRFEELACELVNKSSLGEAIFYYTEPENLEMFKDAVNEDEYKLINPLLISIIETGKKLFGR